jgi:hypothetical protein
MENLEGEVANEEFHKCALGHDILSADLNGEDALLLNILSSKRMPETRTFVDNR